MVDWSFYLDIIIDRTLVYLPKIFYAIVTLVLGWILINWILMFARGRMKSKRVDPSLRSFTQSILKWTLRILLLMTVASQIGIHITSFIALLGAIGLAIGLSLQGSLSNFAGGVLILLFKPFRVGEYIDSPNGNGTVKEITILYTILHTPDNVYVSIPNGPLANNTITNYSRLDTRRMDFTVGISYGDDIDKVRKILLGITTKDGRILSEPEAPAVYVKDLADNSVNMLARFWVSRDEYWNVYWDMRESVKKKFDASKISFPFPQMDVHLHRKNRS